MWWALNELLWLLITSKDVHPHVCKIHTSSSLAPSSLSKLAKNGLLVLVSRVVKGDHSTKCKFDTKSIVDISECMIYMIYIHAHIYLHDIISINAHLQHLNNATVLLCEQSLLLKHINMHLTKKKKKNHTHSHTRSVDYEGGQHNVEKLDLCNHKGAVTINTVLVIPYEK